MMTSQLLNHKYEWQKKKKIDEMNVSIQTEDETL